MPEKTLILIHTPRTAGKTLRGVAFRQFPRDSIYEQHWHRLEDSILRLKNLPSEQKMKLCLIEGHISFGIHQFLPQEAAYLTNLRDPVDRIISHYYSVIERPIHYLHREVMSKHMSLKEYVRSGITTETDNGQVRQLSDLKGEGVAFGCCTPEMLERAKNNLKNRFAVIGLTEKFDETMVLLRRKLGWKKLHYVKIGMDKNCPRREDIPEDTLRVIEEHNKFDIKLYNYAREVFAEEVKKQGYSFRAEVWFFKVINMLYLTCVRIGRLCRALADAAKRGVRKASRRLIRKYSASLGLKTRRSMLECLKKVLDGGPRPGTVIDIGAREGSPELYEAFPGARHILIEPHDRFVPYLARWASRLKSADYIIRPISSISGKAVEGFDDISHPFGKLTYSTITIDEICRQGNTRGPYLLKIYAPGRERDILKSAQGIMKDTSLIVLVCRFADISKPDSLMQGYMASMDGHGFYLHDMGYNCAGKAISQIHMVFRRCQK